MAIVHDGHCEIEIISREIISREIISREIEPSFLDESFIITQACARL